MSGDASSVVILLIEALAPERVVAGIEMGFCEDMSGGREALALALALALAMPDLK